MKVLLEINTDEPYSNQFNLSALVDMATEEVFDEPLPDKDKNGVIAVSSSTGYSGPLRRKYTAKSKLTVTA